MGTVTALARRLSRHACARTPAAPPPRAPTELSRVLVCGRAPNSGDSYALWRVMGTGARRGAGHAPTGIAPHDSAMEIATGIAPASSRTRRPKLNTPAAPNSTHRHSTSHSPPLNFHSPPPVKSPVKILDARTRTQDFRELSPLCISTYHITISSLEKFHITCPSRSTVHLLWISECVLSPKVRAAIINALGDEPPDFVNFMKVTGDSASTRQQRFYDLDT